MEAVEKNQTLLLLTIQRRSRHGNRSSESSQCLVLEGGWRRCVQPSLVCAGRKATEEGQVLKDHEVCSRQMVKMKQR